MSDRVWGLGLLLAGLFVLVLSLVEVTQDDGAPTAGFWLIAGFLMVWRGAIWLRKSTSAPR